MNPNVRVFGHCLPAGVTVIDLETQPGKDRSPRALDGASIYAVGYVQPKDPRGKDEPGTATWTGFTEGETVYLAPFRLLVGHNIKFDLDHIRRSKCPDFKVSVDFKEFFPLWEWLVKNAAVWDTQYLTYLHSGHAMKYPTLEESLEYWGLTGAKTFDIGVELSKVDWDISRVPDLIEYLHSDVQLTSQLFLKQLEHPWVKENMAWILGMMQGLLGTFEIEYNGMKVDHKALKELESKAIKEITKAEEDIYSIVMDAFGPEVAVAFNANSPKQLGTLLYGGTYTYEKKNPVGTFKAGARAGQIKFKTTKYTVEIPALAGMGTSTDDDALERFMTSAHASGYRSALAKAVQTNRKWNKLNGTYLEGLAKHLKMDDKGEVYVHPQINLCQTDTGRTSASKPNIQNNPTHDLLGVKQIYTSRYGSEGCFVEVDFKQIEVLALAHISKDPQLIDDITHGRDIHEQTGKYVYTGKMSKEQRRIIKTINFGLIYGGGAEQLALHAGVPVGTAKKAVEAFYKQYPMTRLYFEMFRKELQRYMDIAGKLNDNLLDTKIGSIPQKRIVWESLTGRRYAFNDYWSDFSKKMEVSYTQSRNYPIQGLATGDLVLNALGNVWRVTLQKYPDVKLIGLIHDSLVFDLKACNLTELIVDLRYELSKSGENLSSICPQLYWKLPIKVEFSSGPNLGAMKEI